MHRGRQTPPPLPPWTPLLRHPPVVWLDGGLRSDSWVLKTEEKISIGVLQAPSLKSELNFVLFSFPILSNHPYP